ncbi:hypothetical protein [Achromobacter ruhlandii]|uniref:hypothetical protein n=1 Tax=Achromobacter ruhlandii TaxID=72557 RepID=UPI003BA2FD57
MGWNDHFEDYNPIYSLPLEALEISWASDGRFNPSDKWLRTATEEQQRIAIEGWFRERFRPGTRMDHWINGRHRFTSGSPVAPYAQLKGRFRELVEDEFLGEIASYIESKDGAEWIEIPPELDDYDERFDLHIANRTDPLLRLRQRLEEVNMILRLQSDPRAKEGVRKLAYGSLIGILEAFLWETAEYWVFTQKDVLRACIEKLPALKDQPMTLGKVFEQYAAVEQTVRTHLQNTVWHRWKSVGPIYKWAIGVELPSFEPFDEALVIRHHIVHRNGTDHDGNPVLISDESVFDLTQSVLSFAQETTRACEAKFDPLA